MSLPNLDRAVIDPAKVRDYLLSDVHPVGRFKAAFFKKSNMEDSYRNDTSRFSQPLRNRRCDGLRITIST